MAARIVVFSELSPKTKVRYTRFLLDHDIHFSKRASDNKYVASIRLSGTSERTAPSRLADKATRSTDHDCSSADPEHESDADATTDDDPHTDTQLATLPLELRPFVNLIALLGTRAPAHTGNSGVFVKETRLVRLINEIYDARHDDASSAETNPSAALDDDSQASGSRQLGSNAFCRFIKHYLTTRFGLKKLVEQQAWELIDGLRRLQHRVDVALFVAFLDGRYSEATLLFTLFARATALRASASSAYRPMLSKTASAERKMRKSASTTAATAPVWLSKSHVESLAQSLFGSKTDDMYLEFMHAMRAFVLSQPTARTPEKLVEANELLFIAAETYEKSAQARDSTGPMAPATDPQDVSTSHNLAVNDSESESDAARTSDARIAQSLQRVQAAALRPHVPQRDQIHAPPPPEQLPKVTTVSAAALLGDTSSDDVQRRLGSLLARMQRRQAQASD